MREIKFRGKRIDNGEWVYGYYADEYGASGIFVSGTDEHPNLIWHDVDEETVGQYTGLKDKNGKEIYEGDIVKCYKKHDELDYKEPSCGREWKEGFAEASIEFRGLGFEFNQRNGSDWFFYGPESREFFPEHFATYDTEYQKEEWIEVIGTIHDKE